MSKLAVRICWLSGPKAVEVAHLLQTKVRANVALGRDKGEEREIIITVPAAHDRMLKACWDELEEAGIRFMDIHVSPNGMKEMTMFEYLAWAEQFYMSRG